MKPMAANLGPDWTEQHEYETGRTMTNVYGKLNEARKRFHELKLEKSGLNKFAGYRYFELADFLIPALGIFEQAGLCAVISFDATTATMLIVDVDTAYSITITSPMGSAALKGCHEVQNIGAVETYQRRYLWTVALEIVEHDALDATTGSDKVIPADFSVSPTKEAWNRLQPEVQNRLRSIALQMLGQEPKRQIEMIESSDLDADEKVGLWSLLDSKTRSAIKAAQKEQQQ